MDDNNLKFISDTLLFDYANGKETIEEVAKKYKEMLATVRSAKDYTGKMGEITGSIFVLNKMISLAKFEHNRKDMQPIIELFKDEIKELEKLGGNK